MFLDRPLFQVLMKIEGVTKTLKPGRLDKSLLKSLLKFAEEDIKGRNLLTSLNLSKNLDVSPSS